MENNTTQHYPITCQLVLLCSRKNLTPEQVAHLKKLRLENNEWHNLFELAIRHRVFPLVYRTLRAHCSEQIPQVILEKSQDNYRKNGTRNLLMTGCLIRVLSLLEEHEIPAMAFKGPVLNTLLYGDSGLRSFCDIDVLIQRKHLPLAVKILTGQDFIPPFSLNEQQLHKLSKTDNEFPLVQTNGVSLDLQWEVTGGYFPLEMTFDTLYEKHQIIEIGGNTIPTFSDEDLLFYLCVHGNQHTWKQLDHVCCVATLIENSPDIDWDAVFLTASKYYGLRMLCIGLLLAQDLFDITIPEIFSIRLQEDPRTIELAQQISLNLLSSTQSPSGSVSHRFMKYHLLSMDNPFLTIRYALRLFFIPTRYDWQRHPLPACLSFLHYLIRPFRLGWEGIKRMLYRPGPRQPG